MALPPGARLLGRYPAPGMHSLNAETVWRELSRAGADRRHPWRVVALCTQGDQGPQARHLILRQVMPEQRRLFFYTDTRTQKLREIDACPQVALLMWDPGHRRQLRTTGQAARLEDPRAVQMHWAKVPEAARRDYATVAAPGVALVAGTAEPELDLAMARQNFSVVSVQLDQLEWLELGHPQHRRIGWSWDAAAQTWQAQSLVP